jgi:alkanesulfonate monooxygenase SsuD/methylene tetrahydromethanopterin reductase-like flavin-dependent oxidoreductase (luciferase family)
MADLRLGVMIPPVGRWQDLAEQFRWAEATGYDIAYGYDHLTHPTVPGEWLAEGFAVLAAAAVATERIELGTLVASATLRSAVAMARLAATLDDVSGGRFVLGLGAGSPRCAAADRGADPTPRQMSRTLSDVVVGIREVFAGSTSWQGRTTSFSGLQTAALPDGAEPPFLVLAAHGPRGIRLAAEHAGGWNTYGGPRAVELSSDDFWELVRDQVRETERACAEVGRDPASLRRSLLLGYGAVQPTADVPAYLAAAERAEEAGFDELVVYGPRSPGEGFGSDPEVHSEAVSTLRGG